MGYYFIIKILQKYKKIRQEFANEIIDLNLLFSYFVI